MTSRAPLLLGFALIGLAAEGALAEPRFLLADGQAIRGEIVQATRNTLTVRRALGGIQQIAKGELQRVEVAGTDGTAVSGAFAGWRDGRLAIRSGTELVWIEDDQVVERESMVAATASRARGEARESAIARPAAFARATPPPAEIAPAAGAPRLDVEAASEVEENAGEVVFTLKLGQALDEPLTVVFSTVDGAALEGVDYQPQNGVLTIPAGSTAGEIRVRLLENDKARGDRDFHLIVAANPERATVLEEWTSVTIRAGGD